jgi:hypothetical protein
VDSRIPVDRYSLFLILGLIALLLTAACAVGLQLA